MDIRKKAIVTFNISAQSSKKETINVEFSTQDHGAAGFTFLLKHNNKPLDLTGIEGELDLLMLDNTRLGGKVSIIDAAAGSMEYILTDEEIKYPGRVDAELILKSEGKSIGGLKFLFTIQQSLRDKNIPPIKDVYVQTFEDLANEIHAKAEAIEEVVNALEEGVTESIVVQVETAKGEHPNLDARIKDEVGKLDSEIQKTTAALADTAVNKPKTTRIPVKRPIVTFWDDDGYDDTYKRFYPLFKSKGIPLTCALITSYLDDPNGRYMTRKQVKELISEGWEMVGHTHNGHSPNMTVLSEQQLIQDIAECRRQLNLLGSYSRGFAYPQGATNSLVMRELQKHFDFAVSVVNGVNQSPDMDMMQIGRSGFGWDSTITLNDFKAQVDEVERNGGWLIVMLHSEPTTDTQLNELSQLIDYIQAKNIDIVNGSEGYEMYGSKFYMGDKREKYINFTDDGIYGNLDLKLTNMLPMKKTTWNGKVPTDGIETYESGFISVTQIAAAHGSANNFPDKKGGMLLTYKYDKDYPGYNRQEYLIYNSLDSYVRYPITQTTWSEWEKTMAKTETDFRYNIVKNADLPNAFSRRITVDALTQAHMTTNGFPGTDAGVLTTIIADNDKTFAQQELRDRTNKVWVRTGISNAWTVWKELPATIVIKAGNLTSAVLNFPNVPANSTMTKNVTIEGISVGRRVILNPNTPLPEGLMFSAWISDANTLTVRVANISATVQSATTNWNYTVI